MQEVAMQQVSVLVYADVMKENGQPWTYQRYILVARSVCFLGLDHD